jgi:HlyD family secretion protein
MVKTGEGLLREARGGTVRAFLVIGSLVLLVGSLGCKRQTAEASSETGPPPVPLVKTTKPERMTFHRLIEQPAWVEAFEVTPIYAKISGYVQDVRADIGTRVRKDGLLAKLFVPELNEEVKQKAEQVHQAEKILAVAQARIVTAKAQVQEAEAALARCEAAHAYWKGQSERFTRIGRSTEVMDRQSVEEALNQSRSAAAGVREAEARIESARANLKEMESNVGKAEADIGVARADERRVAAMLSYTDIRAPFDGIVSHRHVHTGHFLHPSVAGNTGKAEPLFVVVRMDRVRVYLDVPEADAVLVQSGAPASIRVPALNDREFAGTIAGSSWSLEPGQRTLRTEIDFDNPKELLRPGMYAHASIPADQLDTFSLPSSSVLIRDGQSFCICVEDGKAVKTVLRIGNREGDRVEVLKKLGRRKQAGATVRWEDFSGKEMIVVNNPGELSDGQTIRVGKE